MLSGKFHKILIALIESLVIWILCGQVSAFNVPVRTKDPAIHSNSLWLSEASFSRTVPIKKRRECITELTLFRRLFRQRNQKDERNPESTDESRPSNPEEREEISDAQPSGSSRKLSRHPGKRVEEVAAVCVIGGGVSGLVAATEAAEILKGDKVILLEANQAVGGRVRSETTKDGFVLDRGFAVFIEEYPFSKKLLDFETLKLKKFLPGALVKLKGQKQLARVSDPLRQPQDILGALLSPVGSLGDKFALVPLIFHCRTTDVEDIFLEEESDTLTALRETWGASDTILDRFFKPFLEGIYLAPLEEQSSRMFEFVFKMFSEGAATLPQGGMGAVSRQLAEKAKEVGVEIRTKWPVKELSQTNDGFLVKTRGNDLILAKSVICATEGPVALELISQIRGFESPLTLPKQPQRSVGCLYYSFKGEPPVTEPILILSGMGGDRGSTKHPINNVCFPSVVNKGYAPEGTHLCSVTVLESTLGKFRGHEGELETNVRLELATWFPDFRDDILFNWQLKKIYEIKNAQPGQLKGPFPANVYGGRDCDKFLRKQLPKALFVCGDHMATATLNGALESGVNAGIAAAQAALETSGSVE